LAERAGVSRTEVSAIEQGRLVPSVAVALRLAAAIGETVETMFERRPRSAQIQWAWPPGERGPLCWRASMNGQVLAYPVEHTAAGSIPHDGTTASTAGASRGLAHSRPDHTLILAGCDPTVGLLVREMAARHDVRVVPLLRSSGEALKLLRAGLVHVAGVHLTDASGRTANDLTVKRTLGDGYRLVHQLRWDAGIAVDVARTERSAAALLKANVRWVNREEGSAARHAFDLLIASRRRPSGYEHVVRDHRAVATTVSSGWANAGICVKPAATDANLRFIPLHQEAYELCIAESHLDDPRIAALVATLQSSAYRQQVSDVPGCVARETGNVRLVA
jgi:molybdate-binding protein/DNA-binding XRE family transcriptional regulator